MEAKSHGAAFQVIARQGLNISTAPVPSADLASLFPAGVVAMEMRDTGDPASLRAEEAKFVAQAVPSRVSEFATGRLCARHAMAEFGVVDFPLQVASDRRPLWPDSLVGSITHTAGLCAAVVAERRILSAVGLDSEVVADVGEPLWRKICVAAEIAWLKSLARAQRASAAALIFSAKEAFYKCQYPLTGEALTFQDVRVMATFGSASGDLVIVPLRPLACAGLTADPIGGKFRFHDQFVTTGLSFASR